MMLTKLQHPNKETISNDTFIDQSNSELIIRRPLNNSWDYVRTGYFVKNFKIQNTKYSESS